MIKNIGEKSKISIRNIRREANDQLKTMLKEKTGGEDENNKYNIGIINENVNKNENTNSVNKDNNNISPNAPNASNRNRGVE